MVGGFSLLLTACGGGSSSSSNDDPNLPDELTALDVYTDTSWSAGVDELVGLTYPQGADNGPLIALKRTDNGDDSFSHTLMLADADSKEFTDTGISLERSYYRDVLAVPVSVTVNGEEIDTVVVATCGYDEPGIPDGAEPSGFGPSMSAAAEALFFATLEFYVPGTDIAGSVNITDDVSLFSCASLGGLTITDTADKGLTVYEVDFLVSGFGNGGNGYVFGAGFDFDYAAGEITAAGASILDTLQTTGALERNGDGDPLIAVNMEGDTALIDSEANDFVLETAGNVFTSDTDNGADILDLARGGNDLFAVSADAGLAGGDFSGEEFVLVSGGDFERCVDALAVNGTTLWCHDSADEGKLIEFTAPEVPQTQIVAAAERAVSDHSWTQIKAELEGAGAEVEVK
ncbi:MAG: hypothetical protein CMI10_08630 [Oceanospirillaceae bacterium]|nr:hypothetical protein [Oceanospirillaceae bacterium]